MPASRTRTATPLQTPLRELTREVISIPTAAYLEGAVVRYLRRFAGQRGLDCSQDIYGNVSVTYRRGRRRRPLVLGAHIDHPGFVVTAVKGRRLTLEFRGGLSASYGKGEPLRIYSTADGATIGTARVTSVQASPGGATTF